MIDKTLFLEKLEELLNGFVIAGEITRTDVNIYLKDARKWLKTAKPGETYWALGIPVKL